jgi:hypothetical protein
MPSLTGRLEWFILEVIEVHEVDVWHDVSL